MKQSHSAVSVWRVAVLALLCAVFVAHPARAGNYVHDVVSSSGSVIFTPTSGPAQTIPLTDASFSYGDYYPGFYGSISYSYSETIEYRWAHDDDYVAPDDPPSSTPLEIGVNATLLFVGSSGEAYESGHGTGTITVNGASFSAERVTEPDGQGGSTTILDTSGTDTLPVEITLSGESGSYTITYSASMAPGSVMGGYIEVQRSIPLGNGKYVNIKSPKSNTHFPAGTQSSVNINFNGWWRVPPGYSTSTMRVKLEVYYSTLQTTGTSLGTVAVNNLTGNWSKTASITAQSVNITIIALLQVQKPDGSWDVPPGIEADCRHRISISVR